MKVLVTGGGGFLGSNVADELSSRGHKVFIYDFTKSKWLKKNQKFIYGNINDEKKLSRIIKHVDVIYNFAALADLDEARFLPIETIKLNILSVVMMLNLAKKYKIKRFIQASSVYANSEEGGFYAKSKRAAEDYICEFNKIYKTPFTILRYGSLYGERADANNGIKKLIVSVIKKNKIIYRGNRNATRRYIHVKDASFLSANILSSNYKNKILTITGKKTIKVIDIVNFISKKFNIKKNKNRFLNEKDTARYTYNPTPVMRKEGKNIFMKKERNFKSSMIDLIFDVKNNI